MSLFAKQFYTVAIAGGHEVMSSNGVKAGEFLTGDDGFYGFWPAQKGGYWTEFNLAGLAERLRELNEPHHLALAEFFARGAA